MLANASTILTVLPAIAAPLAVAVAPLRPARAALAAVFALRLAAPAPAVGLAPEPVATHVRPAIVRGAEGLDAPVIGAEALAEEGRLFAVLELALLLGPAVADAESPSFGRV